MTEIKWPNEFPELKVFDKVLRCEICYEYMETAMSTPCSHTFCSMCIRKFLMYKNECPSCFQETVDAQLRNNRILDEVIIIFIKLRDHLIDFLKENSKSVRVAYISTPNAMSMPNTSDLGNNLSGKQTVQKNLSLVFNTQVKKTKHTSNVISDEKEIESLEGISFHEQTPVKSIAGTSGSGLDQNSTHSKFSPGLSPGRKITIPEMFSPRKKQNFQEVVSKVSCPVCQVDVPDKNINLHLDDCLKRIEEHKNKRKENEKRKPLPKLVYSILSLKELKRRMKEVGLNTTGNHKLLINRHQRFTLLYNAECDKLNPRPVSEIVKQVEKDEREDKKPANPSNSMKSFLNINKTSDEKTIESAQQKYLAENKSSFDMLIKTIKNREASKTCKPEPDNFSNTVQPEIITVENDSETSKLNIEAIEVTQKNNSKPPNSVFNFIDYGHISDDTASTDSANITQAFDSMRKSNKSRFVISSDSEEDAIWNENTLELTSPNKKSPVISSKVKKQKPKISQSPPLSPDIFETTALIHCNNEDNHSDAESVASVSLLADYSQEETEGCPVITSVVTVTDPDELEVVSAEQVIQSVVEIDSEKSDDSLIITSRQPKRGRSKLSDLAASEHNLRFDRVLRKRAKR